MKNPRKLFHTVSYIQYPLMLGAIGFYFPFIISMAKRNPDWTFLNYTLILFGVALSFSTLQDTSKTQNKLSKKIWENPKKGKIAIILIALLALSFITFGLLALYFSTSEMVGSVAIGITVLGTGLIGLLKSAIEMFENHRKDKGVAMHKNQ